MAFKVIEGGGEGPPDRDGPAAVEAFKQMTIEILRALVRGNDDQGRVRQNVAKLWKHLEKTGADPDQLIETAIKELNACIDTDPELDLWHDLERVVHASLQVAAESCCTDNAAQGRTSKLKRSLETRIDLMIQSREKPERKQRRVLIAPPPPAPAPKKGRRSSSAGWGFHIDVKDPALLDQYRAAGFEVLEDGEWEARVKNSPMGKRESKLLGSYFSAKGELVDVKGAGGQIGRRLVARSYIEVAQSRGEDRVPLYRITPAGEAEWLRIAEG